eukprot:CAMPEP_0185845652 /NCGR_PEP_ID=MMETSP1354-20130828/1556_1 /TAXON_ID=708628 /ORGANISM="Erythrolobus madagascarensis, Strain CCMP3276" /LENGTH=169 /DNA_ID=CAMNT_0028545655 /DNA_START=159 /DNA_END=668 /DNA_ORIENTATION=-
MQTLSRNWVVLVLNSQSESHQVYAFVAITKTTPALPLRLLLLFRSSTLLTFELFAANERSCLSVLLRFGVCVCVSLSWFLVGLRYDDLLNEYDPEVAKVLKQLPPRELELRQKRLQRAMDLDIKKTYLDPEIAAKEDVWNPYIRSRIAVLKKDRLEKQISDFQVQQVKE